MSEKKVIKIGNGTKKSDKWLKSSICLTDIPKELTFEYNGKTYVKVDINIYASPNQFGKDVSISIDEWKPSGQQYNVPEKRNTAADNIAKENQKKIVEAVVNEDENFLPF
jgi:hypothetical protein